VRLRSRATTAVVAVVAAVAAAVAAAVVTAAVVTAAVAVAAVWAAKVAAAVVAFSVQGWNVCRVVAGTKAARRQELFSVLLWSAVWIDNPYNSLTCWLADTAGPRHCVMKNQHARVFAVLHSPSLSPV
jgi:hypothetical protein